MEYASPAAGSHRNLLLELLARTPVLARELAVGRTTPTDGGTGWPAGIVLGHLAHVDANVWLPRMHEMAAADDGDVPTWQWWEPDWVDWATLYGGRPVDEVAQELAAARTATVSYLGRLAPDGWARLGRHAVFGDLDVVGLCEQVLAHDDEHLAQLRRP